jgi:hypothetical protein
MNCAWCTPQTEMSAPAGRHGYSEALPGHDAAAVAQRPPERLTRAKYGAVMRRKKPPKLQLSKFVFFI